MSTSHNGFTVIKPNSGGLWSLGSHLLDVFDYIFGPLQQVSGMAKNSATPQLKVEDGVAMAFLAAGVPATRPTAGAGRLRLAR